MAVYSFDGNDLKLILRGSVELLEQSREHIDSLNVFPVPDGDTGSNMYQTLTAALKEALLLETDHIGMVAEAAARGALVGARGNSGVILSQVLQGFAQILSTKETASASDIAAALDNGSQLAYRAVMSPVEGTILTVVKKSAEEASNRRSVDLLRIMAAAFKGAFNALEKTPDLLPVLKQAGVVDAGGQGFVTILEGARRALKSASPAAKTLALAPAPGKEIALPAASPDNLEPPQCIDFAYCTELILKGSSLPQEIIKKGLSPLGDCLLVVGGDDLLKIHIHSNHPGLVLECCLKYGSLHDLKINNMVEQSKENKPGNGAANFSKPFGIVSVGAGEGITSIMMSLGADRVIAGGQTMNPSTGEILKAAGEVPAKKVIILPNNKNIILSARQAGEMSAKDITVIPSKSIPQGLSALLTLNSGDDFDTAVKKMEGALGSVRTAEITRAIRDTVYGNLDVKKEEYIGIIDGDLKVSGPVLSAVLEDTLRVMIEGDGSLVTLYYGENMDRDSMEAYAEKLQEKYRGNEFEIQEGGQPVYDLIISVE
ncbi:DAK2 domain-containing protein [Pelotomaculum propionicicum]|uniref:DAK2 domain-containing protein n=1 Tax=Pelotomaculum propionicicum TaxID=258475 RepID=UPI003B76DBB1